METVSVMLDGIMLHLTEMVSEHVRSYIRSGYYEWHERQVLGPLLRPDDIVLELGTGLGFLALWCGKRCERVVTVESNPKLYETIRDTLCRNHDKPRFLPIAVSRSGGPIQVVETPDFWGCSTKYGGSQPSVRFCDLLVIVQPTVLVMDIEGGEEDLAGSRLTPEIRAVVIEYHGGAELSVQEWMTTEGFEQTNASENVLLFKRVPGG